MLLRCEADVAVDAGPRLELVPVAHDLVGRTAAAALDRLGKHARGIVAQRDPPQQRVAHLDLFLGQAGHEIRRARRQLAVLAEADVAEIVRVDLVPVFGLLQERLGLARAQGRLADHRHVPAHGAARVQTRQEAGVDAPRHDDLRPGVAHAQQFGLEIGIGRINMARVDHIGALGLQHRHVGLHRRRAVARGVADDRRLLELQHVHGVVIGCSADLLVGRRVAEGHRVFLDVYQLVDPARMPSSAPRDQRRGRQRLARVERPPDDVDLLVVRPPRSPPWSDRSAYRARSTRSCGRRRRRQR